MHYSAALHDSGIFYRYLLKCGADENIQDKVSLLSFQSTKVSCSHEKYFKVPSQSRALLFLTKMAFFAVQTTKISVKKCLAHISFEPTTSELQ